jgi:N-acetylneuraminic acid mutarotase
VFNSEIHILGGFDGPDRAKHYKFNGTSWTEVSILPFLLYGHAIVFNNEIHLLGGSSNLNEELNFYKIKSIDKIVSSIT